MNASRRHTYNRFVILILTLLAVLQFSGFAQPLPTITVKLLDAVDSDRDGTGKQFRASVSRASQLGGTAIPVGTPAIVVLAPGTGGNARTLNLTSITLNGQTYNIVGQNPEVVPVSVTDVMMIRKGAVSTPGRIAVAAGLSVRFSLSPLPPKQNAPAAAAQTSDSSRALVPGSPAPAPGTPAIPASGNLAPEPGTQAGAPDAIFESRGFRVRLVGCSKQGGASVTCDFQVTNLGEDGRRVTAGAARGFGIIDSKGEPIALTRAQLANNAGWVESANGITMPARTLMAGVDPNVTTLSRVPFSLRLFPATMSYFEWRNVPLSGVPPTQSPTPSAAAPSGVSSNASAGNVVDVDGYRFTAIRCIALPASTPKLNDTIYPGSMAYVGFLHMDETHPLIECSFRVENSRANRDLILDGATLIGDDGISYDSRTRAYSKPLSMLGWYGKEADFRKASTIPYCSRAGFDGASYTVAPPDRGWGLCSKYVNAPAIAAGDPEYFWAIFLGPPASLTSAAQIRLTLRTGRANGSAGYSTLPVNFRTLPITLFSKAAVVEMAARTAPKPTPASVTPEVALQKFWDRFISKCGGTWYSRKVIFPGPLDAPTGKVLYGETEYRNASFTPVGRVPISETDRMNGLEWKVTQRLRAAALRERGQNDDLSWRPWSEWRSFLPLEEPAVIVQKKNGFVTYLLTSEVPYEQLDKLVQDGPACGELKR